MTLMITYETSKIIFAIVTICYAVCAGYLVRIALKD